MENDNKTPTTTQTTAPKSKKPVIIVAVVLVLAVAALLAVYFATRPATQEGAKTVTLLVVTDETTETITLKTDEEFLGAALQAQNLVEGDVGEFGMFINSVNGIAADADLQQWWMLTKAGEMVNTGADTTPIADGEQYELTLVTGW